VVLGGRRINVVTAGSDADFRALNTRSADEQVKQEQKQETTEERW
jgi:hypothetical protein